LNGHALLNGFLQVSIDFGNVFAGEPRNIWLGRIGTHVNDYEVCDIKAARFSAGSEDDALRFLFLDVLSIPPQGPGRPIATMPMTSNTSPVRVAFLVAISVSLPEFCTTLAPEIVRKMRFGARHF